MRISDWISDVCASDLAHRIERPVGDGRRRRHPVEPLRLFGPVGVGIGDALLIEPVVIGRAAMRVRRRFGGDRDQGYGGGRIGHWGILPLFDVSRHLQYSPGRKLQRLGGVSVWCWRGGGIPLPLPPHLTTGGWQDGRGDGTKLVRT